MPEQFLNHANVGSAVDQMGGERVPQCVRGDSGEKAGLLGCTAQYRPCALPRQPTTPRIEEHRRTCTAWQARGGCVRRKRRPPIREVLLERGPREAAQRHYALFRALAE